MIDYNETDQTMSNSSSELIKMKHQLDQALSLIDELRQERDDRDQWYQDEVNRNVWLEEQNETLRLGKEYVTKADEWKTDLVHNKTIDPYKVRILISLYPYARSGKWMHIAVKSTAFKLGMYRSTLSKHLHEMGDAGLIEVEGETWFTGKKGKDGKDIYKTEINIRFTEELIKFPGEVLIEKEDKRKDNGTGGGKNAKPKQCPECKSVQVDALDKCKCRACNHEWEDGPARDANEGVELTPWDYGQANNEDAAELAKQFEEDAKETPVDHLPKNFSEGGDETPVEPEWFNVFYQEPTPTPIIVKPKDPRLPNRACFKCDAQDWRWNDVLNTAVCGGCG